MPIIRINARGRSLCLHGSPQPMASVLNRTRSVPGPVIVMTHGYKYRPGHKECCPHRYILSLRPEAKPWIAPSWPQALGFGDRTSDEGLAIAFGWDARGALWQAHNRAQEAGRALADLIKALRHVNPNRTVHFLGHSMGAEVVMEALHHLPAGALNRIISLTGATYRYRALEALQSPAGQKAEFINVTSRENDLFDFLFERLIAPGSRGDRAIGLGIEAPNAVTLQLDCPRTLAHLASLGPRIDAPQHRVCHWSSYMRPGVLSLYRELLRNHQNLPLSVLRRGLPQHSSRRWSRLFALPHAAVPLPFAQKTS